MTIAYPMVEDDEAVGRVAAVYAAALEGAPFVPSLLKSLALCPPYLVLAWEQAAPVLGDSAMSDTARELAAEVQDAAVPPGERHDRELLSEFVEPLARMLLLACGLLAALDDDLPGLSPAVPRDLEPPRSPLARPIPTVAELVTAAPVFGRIRAGLDTPIINTIWRRVAAEGRLEAIWSHLEAQTAVTRPRAAELQRAAMVAARDLPWTCVADRRSLAGVGIADAAPGAVAILEAYVNTLPRVLTLVASCRTTR